MRPRGSSGALFVYMSLKRVPYIRGYSKVLTQARSDQGRGCALGNPRGREVSCRQGYEQRRRHPIGCLRLFRPRGRDLSERPARFLRPRVEALRKGCAGGLCHLCAVLCHRERSEPISLPWASRLRVRHRGWSGRSCRGRRPRDAQGPWRGCARGARGWSGGIR